MPAEGRFLLFDAEFVPAGHVMRVFLNDDVGAARIAGGAIARNGSCSGSGGSDIGSRLGRVESGILGHIIRMEEHCIDGALILWVLRAVDEAENVAFVEIAEAVDFVGDVDRPIQRVADESGEFEAHVHAASADVEQQVTRGGRCCVDVSALFDEGVEVRGAGRGEHAVPEVGADARDTAEIVFAGAEADCSGESCDFGQEVLGRALEPGADGEDEEDCIRRWRNQHPLRTLPIGEGLLPDGHCIISSARGFGAVHLGTPRSPMSWSLRFTRHDWPWCAYRCLRRWSKGTADVFAS